MASRLSSGLCRLVAQSSSLNLSRSLMTKCALGRFSPLAVTSTPFFTGFHQKFCMSTDAALREFLKEEIQAEKEVAKKQMSDDKPLTISGFQMKTDDAEVTLTKQFNKEKITVIFNINECVRPQDDVESGSMDKYNQEHQDSSKEENENPVSILAEPSFRVEVEKNNQKLVFECDFIPEYQNEEGVPSEESPQQDEESDLFNISSVYLTTGDVTDKVYGASGEILDGNLYDHLFDYLAERGIDNKFADELVRFATHYEHAQYVALLQKIKDFVSS